MRNKGSIFFRFEEAWTRDKKCEALVREVWRNSPGQGAAKITGMKCIEEQFQKYKVSAITKELRRIEDLLKDEVNWDPSEEALKAYKVLETQRNSLLQVEEIIWRKKSRALWLQHGDKYSKKFIGKLSRGGKSIVFTR